jgi:hypothetical protein
MTHNQKNSEKSTKTMLDLYPELESTVKDMHNCALISLDGALAYLDGAFLSVMRQHDLGDEAEDFARIASRHLKAIQHPLQVFPLTREDAQKAVNAMQPLHELMEHLPALAQSIRDHVWIAGFTYGGLRTWFRNIEHSVSYILCNLTPEAVDYGKKVASEQECPACKSNNDVEIIPLAVDRPEDLPEALRALIQRLQERRENGDEQ